MFVLFNLNINYDKCDEEVVKGIQEKYSELRGELNLLSTIDQAQCVYENLMKLLCHLNPRRV